MQLESLKVFCDVARQRSFSQAAAANDVSQSAASQIVLQLEKRLGVQLIDRSTRPLKLTAAGQVYYEGCRGLVEQYLELEASVRDARASVAGTVQVAAIYSVGLRHMSQYVERFATQQPDAEVHIEYLHPDRVYDNVLAGTADLGLVSFPRPSREITCMPWREEEMVLACPPSHPLARCRSVRPAQLKRRKYVGFEKGLVIRREVDRFLREHGVTVDVVLEFDNIENIKKAVEISASVALLPRPTLEREIQAGTLRAVPLAGCRMVRPLGIIHRRVPPLGLAATRFIELLRQPDEPRLRTASGAARTLVQPHGRGNGAARRNGQLRKVAKKV
jgi:DNA-binding transcriptional LysR family regulator